MIPKPTSKLPITPKIDNNLFDYNNNRHDDETVSLASSFISSYNNNIDNNIKDFGSEILFFKNGFAFIA